MADEPQAPYLEIDSPRLLPTGIKGLVRLLAELAVSDRLSHIDAHPKRIEEVNAHYSSHLAENK